jgi:hypothetical protein
MGMKDQRDVKLDIPQPDTAAADEIRRLQEQLAQSNAELAAAREANAELAAEVPIRPLPEDEQPLWEVAGPNSFFSPDCVLYPPGSVIQDPYGTMPLNPELIPLNPAAEMRIDAYLASLPGEGALSHENIVEAALQLRPRDGEDPIAAAAYHGKLLERAMLLKFQQEGRIPPAPGEKLGPQRAKRAERPDPNIPIMGGVRIKALDPGSRFGLGVTADIGPAPARRHLTRAVR